MKVSPDYMVVHSSAPPTVEVDWDSFSAYVRFKRAKIARTVTRPSRSCHVSVDLDRNGAVIGIEILGAQIIQIGKILEIAAVKAPDIDFSQVRYKPVEMLSEELEPA